MDDVLNIRFEHEPAMVSRLVAGEMILVPTQRMSEEAALYALDDVAAFLWERLDGQRTGRDLMAALEADYNTETGNVEQDVRIFLEHLTSIGAIRPASSSA